MKSRILTSAVGFVVLCMVLATPVSFGQGNNNSARQAINPGTSSDKMDLTESSRACAEASRFLAQPGLLEALAAARADKKMANQARMNPGEFLAQHGIMIPANVKVKIDPAGGCTTHVWRLWEERGLHWIDLAVIMTVRGDANAQGKQSYGTIER